MKLEGAGPGKYRVLDADGLWIGTVTRTYTGKARHVTKTGGVTRWVATLPDGSVVSQTNTYRRIDALQALQEAQS